MLDTINVAEGNNDNMSQILIRNKDEHIRAYTRIPNNFDYFISNSDASCC